MIRRFLGGGVAAVAQPNKPSIDEIFPQMSIVSREGHHDLGSIDDVIEELGVEINRPEEVDTEEVVIDVGQAIETIGSDEDNQVEFVDEKLRQKVEENEIAEVLILEKGEVPPDPSESGIDMKSAIVYKSIVDANPDYGDGGGNQYFIPHNYFV